VCIGLSRQKKVKKVEEVRGVQGLGVRAIDDRCAYGTEGFNTEGPEEEHRGHGEKEEELHPDLIDFWGWIALEAEFCFD